MHLDDRRRITARGRRQALGREAEVAELPVEFADLLLGSAVGGRDRGDEKPLAEADLDRLEEWREPPLDQVCDRAELVRRTGPVDLRQDANQLVPFARCLHLVQARGQLTELHGRQLSQTSEVATRSAAL